MFCQATLHVPVDPTSMLDGVERDRSLDVINLEQHPPISHSVFLEAFEIVGKMLQGMMQGFGMRAEPSKFLRHRASGHRIEALQRPLEGGRRLKLVVHRGV